MEGTGGVEEKCKYEILKNWVRTVVWQTRETGAGQQWAQPSDVVVVPEKLIWLLLKKHSGYPKLYYLP